MDYRGSGFWVRDYQAEVWLYLLAQEGADTIPEAPAWLAGARDDWLTQATAGFMGCVSSYMDDHLGTEPDRVALALDLSERVQRRLLTWSPAIPKDLVNSFGTGGEQESFNADLPTGPLLACGRAFISLLRGEFPPGNDGWAH
ncbi:hypothetical protein Pmi06nite_39910 [Planotetraspora mira]|uniref:Uncharacterized protein n=2 Tax=Planotetraspora mira TaxID=58121 RepID=A0A8J3TQW6_9ACTN|nr:hypothetical protein Pmi06nite_39910 [Planotetraspora mira]